MGLCIDVSEDKVLLLACAAVVTYRTWLEEPLPLERLLRMSTERWQAVQRILHTS